MTYTIFVPTHLAMNECLFTYTLAVTTKMHAEYTTQTEQEGKNIATVSKKFVMLH